MRRFPAESDLAFAVRVANQARYRGGLCDTAFSVRRIEGQIVEEGCACEGGDRTRAVFVACMVAMGYYESGEAVKVVGGVGSLVN